MLKNFRKIMSGINTKHLLAQIEANPYLWNESDIWGAGKANFVGNNTDTIVLRYNKSSRPNLNDWDKPAFTTLAAAQPIILDLMRAIPGEHLGKVLITRLHAGDEIATHIDYMPPGVLPYFQRYQIPLDVHPGVSFRCGDEELYMEAGTAYWFDNQISHSVVNYSSNNRISMFADIRPFLPLVL